MCSVARYSAMQSLPSSDPHPFRGSERQLQHEAALAAGASPPTASGLAPKPTPNHAGARADADPSDPRDPNPGTKAVARPSHAGAMAPMRVTGASAAPPVRVAGPIAWAIPATVAAGPTITTAPTGTAVTPAAATPAAATPAPPAPTPTPPPPHT